MAALGYAVVVLSLASVFTSTFGQLEWKLIHRGDNSSSMSPRHRRDAALGYDHSGEVLILFGGRSQDGNETLVLSDTWMYYPFADSWRYISTSDSPSPRHSAVSGVSGDYFYVATGEGRSGEYFDDIWRFGITDKTWQKLPAQTIPTYCTSSECLKRAEDGVIPEPRGGAAGGIMINSSILHLSHGFSDNTYADVFTYRTREKGWELEFGDHGPYNPTYPHARHQHAGTMISEHQLLIFGGCLSGSGTGGPCPSSDLWMFDRTSKDWTSMDGHCARPRTHAAMTMLPIQDGYRKVVIYGGYEEGDQVLKTVISEPNEVAIFDPDMDSCDIKRTTGDIPTKRSSAAVATAQTGIYMFGGFDLESETTLGDLYLLVGDGDSVSRAQDISSGKLGFCNWLLLHGVFMGFAYGFMLIWGAILGHYVDHKGVHVAIQIVGVLLAIAGFVFGILSVKDSHFSFVHGIVGLVVFCLTILQPLNFLFCCPLPSRYPRQAATLHRIWKSAHSFGGYSCLALGLVNISLGVFLADVHRAIWIAWFAYLAFVTLVANAAQFCRRRSGGGLIKRHRYEDNYEVSSKDTPL